MSEYVEKRKIVRAVPVGRPVIETQHDSVIHEPRGMSGGAIVALILSAIAATALITMLIVNNQQRDTDKQLAQERAAAAQQTPAQQQQPQQPPVIVMPQSPPAAVPVPVPTPAPSASAPTTTAPSSVEIEVAVSSKFLDDPDLRSYPIDVKVSGGVATLSGQVPNEQLKVRAERLARRVKGVASVINNIVVQPQ